MARWLVNRNNSQFTVENFRELERLARTGRVEAGDLIQPPGTSEWLYAGEISELSQAFSAATVFDDPSIAPKASHTALKSVLGVVLVALIAGAGFAAYHYSAYLPQGDEKLDDTVSFSEIIVTGSGTPLLAEPDARASILQALTGGSHLSLLAKRGGYYRVRAADSLTEGWVSVKDTLPMYMLGDGEVREQYDPLFNPDRYVDIVNAGWMVLNDGPPKKGEMMRTVFDIMLKNSSRYAMTDLKIATAIKDSRGHELESVEVPIEGVIPAEGTTMVGTLVDPVTHEKRVITTALFDEIRAQDPSMELNFTSGIEIAMEPAEVAGAMPRISELRAVPDPTVLKKR